MNLIAAFLIGSIIFGVTWWAWDERAFIRDVFRLIYGTPASGGEIAAEYTRLRLRIDNIGRISFPSYERFEPWTQCPTCDRIALHAMRAPKPKPVRGPIRVIEREDGTRGEYVIYDVAEIQRTAEVTRLEYKLRPIKEFFHFGPDDAEVKRLLLQNLLQRQPPLWKLPDDPFDASGWQRPSAPVPDEKRRALPQPSTTPPMWAHDPTRSRRPKRRRGQPNRQGIA